MPTATKYICVILPLLLILLLLPYFFMDSFFCFVLFCFFFLFFLLFCFVFFFYKYSGFSTFDLTWQNGYSKTKYGVSYGHIGATYGYDSIVGYYPELDVTISIASNMENDDQTHPSDAMCLLYGQVFNHLTNSSDVCTYTMQGYYGGECKCVPK